jgi:hypothetical protein
MTNVMFSPGRVFSLLGEKPNWYKPFLPICAGTLVASCLIQPFVRRATSLELARIFTGSDLRTALEESSTWFFIGLACIPFLLLAKCLFAAAVVWIVGSVTGILMDFRKTLVVVILSSTPIVLETFYIALILWLRGLDAITNADDLAVAIGANLIIQNSNRAVFLLLGSINVFEIWFIALITMGLSITHGCSLRKALVPTVSMWLIGVVIQFKLNLLVEEIRPLLG